MNFSKRLFNSIYFSITADQNSNQFKLDTQVFRFIAKSTKARISKYLDRMLHSYIIVILKIKVFQLWGLDEEIGCLRSKTSEYVSLQSLNWMKLFRGENDEMIQTYIFSYALLLVPLDRWVIAKNCFSKTHTKMIEQRNLKWK